jgi:prepilin-type N-terminal cleavage/methylation domain-containing protein
MLPPHQPFRWRSRQAFSLIELLVVVGIVALLTGLILAGVEKARVAAYQASCKNHLRQLGLAMHLFHGVNGCFPSSGGWVKDLVASPLGWDLDDPSEWARARFSFPDPNKSAEDQMGSWCYSILPFLEQDNAYQTLNYAAPLKVYVCPARRSAEAQTCPVKDPVNPGVTYYFAGINPWSKTDYNANGLVIQCHPVPMTRITDITDGTATTILLGEKSLDPRNYTTGAWFWDEPVFVGCNARTGTSVYRDQQGVPFQNNWGSAHPANASFLFVDGSVRPLRFGLASGIMEALLTPQGGEKVGEDNY